MSDENNGRPISGEIIGGPPVVPMSAGASADIVDAEFETLRPDPRDRLSTASATIGTGDSRGPGGTFAGTRPGTSSSATHG